MEESFQVRKEKGKPESDAISVKPKEQKHVNTKLVTKKSTQKEQHTQFCTTERTVIRAKAAGGVVAAEEPQSMHKSTNSLCETGESECRSN
jgi:hypothetical protein